MSGGGEKGSGLHEGRSGGIWNVKCGEKDYGFLCERNGTRNVYSVRKGVM